ncbi:hypothetical protein ACFFWC_28270 [Plantactinospora siamensis]|uniref:SUKH-4 immunity protein of toxin-antitoxin system n=1 Tax=Plantactinospora siamensis TaxID=555372 RepID=A0ABV6NQ12_9ACTN
MFPVGRYTGAFHPSHGAPVKYHSLVIGRLSVQLETEAAFNVWVAGHRPPDAGRPWRRADVAEAAERRLGVAEPDALIDEFLTDGLLVEVDPADPDAVEFARAHRVWPLMLPLGNTPDDPLRHGIGLFGSEPVLRVPTLVNDVWMWSSTGGSLWDVCVAFASAGARAAVDDEREHDPRYVLAEFLGGLQELIGISAACLDEAPRR